MQWVNARHYRVQSTQIRLLWWLLTQHLLKPLCLRDHLHLRRGQTTATVAFLAVVKLRIRKKNYVLLNKKEVEWKLPQIRGSFDKTVDPTPAQSSGFHENWIGHSNFF